VQGQISNESLERVWHVKLKIYERMGKADEFVTKVQKLLDRASANGKDVSGCAAALDAFKAALKNASHVRKHQGIINSQQGFFFDSNRPSDRSCKIQKNYHGDARKVSGKSKLP